MRSVKRRVKVFIGSMGNSNDGGAFLVSETHQVDNNAEDGDNNRNGGGKNDAVPLSTVEDPVEDTATNTSGKSSSQLTVKESPRLPKSGSKEEEQATQKEDDGA
ncbi:MAG: hypothetical protein SGILL_004174 [Bacillariaceae sp.]